MDDRLFDPNSLYKELGEKDEKNATQYFDDLVKTSGIDYKANIVTVRRYRGLMAAIAKGKNKRGGLITLEVFSYIFAGVFYALFVTFFILSFGSDGFITTKFGLSLLFALLGTGSLLFGLLFLHPLVKKAGLKINEMQAEADKLLKEAWAQMAPLNELYDWGSQVDIVKETTPIISLDLTFDPKKQDIFQNRFHYDENNLKDTSVYFAQSGTIRDNPFIIERDFIMSMGEKTYYGSITIHWTTTYKDKEGHIQTENHSQELTASITRPCPYYYYKTYIFYGNDAAPNLSFSRAPTHLNKPSEAEVNRFVKERQRLLKRKAKESLMNDKGEIFTPMDNTFEALFQADNRNNEVEYRVLFTPLAAKGMTNLIINSPYGDDFIFSKSGVLNLIRSEHFENENIYANPSLFESFSYEEARANFINYQKNYFQSLYYAIAPILAIPEYENNKPIGYVYHEPKTNLTITEDEIMINSFPSDYFSPREAVTEIIKKAESPARIGILDYYKVHSFSFSGERCTKSFLMHGDDGHTHNVPVNYIEYHNVTQYFSLCAVPLPISKYTYNKIFLKGKGGAWINKFAAGGESLSFQRGILAFIPKKVPREDDAKELETIIAALPKRDKSDTNE